MQSKWSEVTDTAEADAVANAYKEFADMHKAALDVLAGKAGIIGQVLGGPVAAILRLDEGVIDVSAVAFMGCQLVTDHLCSMTANNLQAHRSGQGPRR